MVSGLGNPLLVNSQSTISSTQSRNDAGGQNNGIIARGVGILQKAWLHLTGQARPAHNEQLSNLKAQVHNEIGEAGLSALNDILTQKQWDGPNSTKLFSNSELNSLRSDANVQVRAGQNFSELQNQQIKDNDVKPEMRHGRNFSKEQNQENAVNPEIRHGRNFTKEQSQNNALNPEIRYGRNFSKA